MINTLLCVIFVGRNMTGFEIIEGSSELRLNNSPGGLSVCHSRCFDIVFQSPYRYFSIALKVFFFLSDPYTIFTSNWQWIKICENVVLS